PAGPTAAREIARPQPNKQETRSMDRWIFIAEALKMDVTDVITASVSRRTHPTLLVVEHAQYC
ncbi:MAG TPA: hypothetical protein VJL29_14200, partial [Thermoguttaceae bacterium]|nr:hypothetical protein [Thermoguttaceae bacterium]